MHLKDCFACLPKFDFCKSKHFKFEVRVWMMEVYVLKFRNVNQIPPNPDNNPIVNLKPQGGELLIETQSSKQGKLRRSDLLIV